MLQQADEGWGREEEGRGVLMGLSMSPVDPPSAGQQM